MTTQNENPKDELRLHLDDSYRGPKQVVDESVSARPTLIRYIFTVVMSPLDLPSSDDALAQKAWLDDMVAKIRAMVGVERVGVVAVTEKETK